MVCRFCAYAVQIQMLEGVTQECHGRVLAIALPAVDLPRNTQSNLSRTLPPVDVSKLDVTQQFTVVGENAQIDMLLSLPSLHLLKPFFSTFNG